jgi:pectate lyase
MRRFIFILSLLLVSFSQAQDTVLAFPGAEGFGAHTSGGRGGQVIYVTTLAPDGEGSLQAALDVDAPRTIVFAVSGVIDTVANIRYGKLTIAGQTSPDGITVRGIVCDGHYDANNCDNIIIRHLRSRPAGQIDNADVWDDALRLDGVENVMIDHLSLANASDEALQISMARNVTIQNTILGETVGEHHIFGGLLINYSHSQRPLDNLSIHHNIWYRISGRLPEISCEVTRNIGTDDTAETPSFCGQQALNIEFSNNLLWDAGGPMTYNDNRDDSHGQPQAGVFTLRMNMVNNLMFVPADFPFGMISSAYTEQAGNQIFISGNRMNIYPDYQDLQLVYCCNDFNLYNPNSEAPQATMLDTRLDFPAISYTPSEELNAYMLANVGAFPRDAMDERYMDSLQSGEFPPVSHEFAVEADALLTGGDTPAPIDSDLDGMPDEWEIAHGLHPQLQDHNDTNLSQEGYTNLEVYLNELADNLIRERG